MPLQRLKLFFLRDLPVLIFLFWLERSCALPRLGERNGMELSFPWLSLQSEALPLRVIVDLALLITVMTVLLVRRTESRFLPDTCWPLLLLFPFWQSTGKVLWALPIPVLWTYAISSLVFWLLIGAAVMIGRAQKGRRTPRPIPLTLQSMLLILASLSTPALTLDRFLVGLGILVYSLFPISFSLPLKFFRS